MRYSHFYSGSIKLVLQARPDLMAILLGFHSLIEIPVSGFWNAETLEGSTRHWKSRQTAIFV